MAPAPSGRSAAVPTRERIVRAAMRLFQRRGYHGVGLSEILAAARAPKGSLYHHFPGGKEELAVAALERVRDAMLTSISVQRAKGAGATEVVRVLVKGIAEWLARTHWRERGMVSALADGAAPETPRLRDSLTDAQTRLVAELGALLIAEGVPAPLSRAAFAFAALDGAVLQARLARDATPLRAAAECIAQVFAAR